MTKATICVYKLLHSWKVGAVVVIGGGLMVISDWSPVSGKKNRYHVYPKYLDGWYIPVQTLLSQIRCGRVYTVRYSSSNFYTYRQVVSMNCF